MLWMIIILLIGALSFVMFHKPHVKAMGAGWVPPEQRKLPTPAQPQAGASLAEGTDAEAQPLPEQPAAPQTPDTFDFNDLFGGKKQGPTDRPNR